MLEGNAVHFLLFTVEKSPYGTFFEDRQKNKQLIPAALKSLETRCFPRRK